MEDEFRDVHIEFEEPLGYIDRPIYFLVFEYADLKLSREIKDKKIDDSSFEAMGSKPFCYPRECVLVAQLYPTLCDPWTVAHQTPQSMVFSRQEYWILLGWTLI